GEDAKAALCSANWKEITAFLTRKTDRLVSLERNTKETRITLTLNLDGNGGHHNDTGLKFYDHMLDQLAKHSGVDLTITVKGDLDIDEHHTIEDSAIALGKAFKQALGTKRGIERYGFLLPMDEALVQCAIDFSDRAYFIFKGTFSREYVGDFPTEMFEHWMKSFSEHAGMNLNLAILDGENTHHMIEASFKALAKCIKQAIRITGTELPTTKGVI
ncbi:MAG TPA: imidazoleglycerol-phosphate dehydratase HisB, partial [Sphingobacteriaceae bacterium]